MNFRVLLAKITSRKFLLAVLGAATLATNGQWAEFTALVLGYIAAEGGADAVQRFKTGVSTLDTVVNPKSQNVTQDDEVDTSTIITGDTPLFDEKEKED